MRPVEEWPSGEGVMECFPACRRVPGRAEAFDHEGLCGILDGCSPAALGRNALTVWCLGEQRAGCSWELSGERKHS